MRKYRCMRKIEESYKIVLKEGWYVLSYILWSQYYKVQNILLRVKNPIFSLFPIRNASCSLPARPKRTTEQATATNGCVTLRARAAAAAERSKEASRSFRPCKVSVSFVSPSQSLSWSKVLTFLFAFSFICFFIIKLQEVVSINALLPRFSCGQILSIFGCLCMRVQVALFFDSFIVCSWTLLFKGTVNSCCIFWMIRFRSPCIQTLFLSSKFYVFFEPFEPRGRNSILRTEPRIYRDPQDRNPR